MCLHPHDVEHDLPQLAWPRGVPSTAARPPHTAHRRLCTSTPTYDSGGQLSSLPEPACGFAFHLLCIQEMLVGRCTCVKYKHV